MTPEDFKNYLDAMRKQNKLVDDFIQKQHEQDMIAKKIAYIKSLEKQREDFRTMDLIHQAESIAMRVYEKA